MRILLVGGGTGGHFYPLIAVAEELNQTPEKPKLYYMGPDAFDAEALRLQNIKHVYCPAGKVRRYFSLLNLLDLFKNIFGLFIAFIKLFLIYPDVVFSKGGYTSIPVIIAAKLLMIPIVIHESDAVPGRSSKIGAKLARYIGIAHDDVAKFFPPAKTALVGIPMRKAILERSQNAKQTLNIPADKPLIYVTGGSLGAERLNNQILEILPTLLQRFYVFHQVGEKNIETTEAVVQNLIEDKALLSSYFVQGKLSAEMVALVLSGADLVIARSGSTTLFEIAHHQKPSILVPIPESVSHDQRSNAYSYARSGAAVVLEEGNLNDALLLQEIDSIINDRARYHEMVQATTSTSYPDAGQKIAQILISIGKEHGS